MLEKRPKIEVLLYLITGTFFGFLLSMYAKLPFDANILVAITTILVAITTAALVIVTSWYAHSTHRMAKTAAFVELFKLLQSDDIREARRILMEELKGKKYEEWKEIKEKRSAAEKVCYSYSVAGTMVSKGLIEEDLIIGWHYSITECYEVAKPMIDDYRYKQKRGEEYWKGFDDLYNMMKK